MTASKSKRELVRQLSRDTGMSESSIYKILTNPFSFSKNTVDTVRRAAERYGVTLTDTAVLRVGVVIPSRPSYFWREAVMGMEASKARLEQELEVSIQLVYAYPQFPMEEAENERLFATFAAERVDGLILFPVGGNACRQFVETCGRGDDLPPMPVVIFNDTQDYMTDEWFAARPHMGYIGPDCYDEGCRAALLAQSCGRSLRRVAVICTRHHQSAQASETRVRGMCDRLTALYPSVEIVQVELDPTERVAPAALARRLIDCYSHGGVDCLYISSGVTYIACAAIEKIERRRGESLDTFVIGHECSASDKRYLLEGRQKGYIKQDVYSQGVTALRDVVLACLRGIPLERRLYRSSIFIR